MPDFPTFNKPTVSNFNQLIHELSECTKAMGRTHNNYLNISKRDIDRFLDETKKHSSLIHKQAIILVVLTSLAAVTGIAGALIPKADNHDALKATCDTAAKFFSGITSPVDLYYRGLTTEMEAKRQLLRDVNVQHAQGGKSEADRVRTQAQSIFARILEARSRG